VVCQGELRSRVFVEQCKEAADLEVGVFFCLGTLFWTSKIKYLAIRRKGMLNKAQCLLVIAP